MACFNELRFSYVGDSEKPHHHRIAELQRLRSMLVILIILFLQLASQVDTLSPTRMILYLIDGLKIKDEFEKAITLHAL